MRMLRGALLVLLLGLGGAGVLAVMGGLPFASAQPPNLDPFVAPAAKPSAVPTRPAAFASPSASARPGAAASPAVTSPDIVAVASRGDQKLTYVDPATSKVSKSLDLGVPP